MKEEIKKEENAMLGYDRHSHPSFGMVGINNTQSTGAVLVGSSVRHHNFISLTVHEAVKYRDRYSESFMAKKKVCEVWLSHTQLAEMLFKSNHGDGVPCTLHWVNGDAKVRETPPFESPMKQHSEDLHSALKETLKYARNLAAEAEKLAQTKMTTKVDRDRMGFLAMKIVQDIEQNLKFAVESIDKKMEQNITHAKAEIETFTDSKLKSLGLEHLKGKTPILIEEENENNK